MADFLFHKVSEAEKKQIQKQAKVLMDKFSQRLSKIGKQIDDPLIERGEGERREGGEKIDFSRKIMFENAPNKNKDFFVVERKSW